MDKQKSNAPVESADDARVRDGVDDGKAVKTPNEQTGAADTGAPKGDGDGSADGKKAPDVADGSAADTADIEQTPTDVEVLHGIDASPEYRRAARDETPIGASGSPAKEFWRFEPDGEAFKGGYF